MRVLVIPTLNPTHLNQNYKKPKVYIYHFNLNLTLQSLLLSHLVNMFNYPLILLPSHTFRVKELDEELKGFNDFVENEMKEVRKWVARLVRGRGDSYGEACRRKKMKSCH